MREDIEKDNIKEKRKKKKERKKEVGRGFESRRRILEGMKENGENNGSQMGQTAKNI